jgi:hypothetical protein
LGEQDLCDAEIAADAGNGVKDLSAKVSAYTVDEAANTVTLAAAQATGLKAGDIYILPQTAENPSGAAFKVAAVQTVGGQAVITNEEVALDEVYDEVSFAGDFAPQLAAAKIVAGDGTVLQDATMPQATELLSLISALFFKRSMSISASVTSTSV